MTGLREPGPELLRDNRRLIAERLHWPDGALQACEAIDTDHPGWTAFYMHGGTGGRPAGYTASRGSDDREVFAATPDELRTAIDVSPPSLW